MTVLTGRRRIGKTALLMRSCSGQPTLYFFVTRKAEAILCNEFAEEIRKQLGETCGSACACPPSISMSILHEAQIGVLAA